MVRTNEQKQKLFKVAHSRAKKLQSCKAGQTYAEAFRKALKGGHDASKAENKAGYSASAKRILWEDAPKAKPAVREYADDDFGML